VNSGAEGVNSETERGEFRGQGGEFRGRGGEFRGRGSEFRGGGGHSVAESRLAGHVSSSHGELKACQPSNLTIQHGVQFFTGADR
jgi:hypothetical protein